MTDNNDNPRRQFLRQAIGTAAILPLAGLAARPALAQDDPHAEDGHALNYVNDNTTSDHARHQEGQHCGNCVFYQGGEDEWGPCQHPQFRDVQVNNNGWCSAYAPR